MAAHMIVQYIFIFMLVRPRVVSGQENLCHVPGPPQLVTGHVRLHGAPGRVLPWVVASASPTSSRSWPGTSPVEYLAGIDLLLSDTDEDEKKETIWNS